MYNGPIIPGQLFQMDENPTHRLTSVWVCRPVQTCGPQFFEKVMVSPASLMSKYETPEILKFSLKKMM